MRELERMEENQIQTPPVHVGQNQETPSQHKSSGFKSKLPWIIIAILLVLVGMFGGYFVLGQIKQTTPTPTPTISESPENSPTLEPTSASSSSTLDKTFTSEKLPQLSFTGYTLLYPSDWSLSEQRDEGTPISTVTLTKDDYTLKIFQAATGGAGCIYKGDMPEGPASDYRNNKYKDLITGFATLRQTEAPSGGKMSYNYCQKSETEDSYGQPTSVGHMSITTKVANPDPEIVSEFEKIVESIKTL